MNNVAACQIKFAFDITANHSISWHEYFGFEDGFDMIKFHYEKLLNDSEKEDLSFLGVDSSGAKFTVIFESYNPEFFQKIYEKTLNFLNEVDKNPLYNSSSDYFNSCLEYLNEEGITIFENEPDEKVYEEFNKIVYGYKTYKECIKEINLKEKSC